MGWTLVAAVADENTAFVANVGDSRLYLVRRQDQTGDEDHSYVEELVPWAVWSAEAKTIRIKKNIITRAVGTGR